MSPTEAQNATQEITAVETEGAMRELPQGWKQVRLEEVCEVNPRDPGPSDASQLVSFVPMPAVSDEDGEILEHQARPFGEVSKGYTRFRDGDVIFAKITPCMENGKIAVARGLHNGLACGSTEFHVLRSRGAVLPEYVWRFLRQKSFREEAEQHMTGAVGQRRVPAQYLKEALIPLPPLDEQRRIVARLDALLAHSKRARAELARVPGLVERQRQAVLAAVFTSDQRVSLKNITSLIQYGYTAKSSTSIEGPQYLRITDIQNSSVDWTQVPRISINHSELNKYRLEVGDIVFARSGATVGKSFLITEDPKEAVFASYLIRVRCNHKLLNPEYAALFFQSSDYWQQIQEGASGTGQPNFNGAKLGELSIPMHSLKKQKHLVDVAMSQLDALRLVLREAKRAAALLDRLDQATLVRAFRGEL